MARTKTNKTVPAKLQQPRLLEQTLSHVEQLWTKCEKRFLDALNDSERRKICLSFDVTLDLSEPAPTVDSALSFKDKCQESGMEVNKTFKSKLVHTFDDPRQPRLPGVHNEDEDEAVDGKSAAARNDD